MHTLPRFVSGLLVRMPSQVKCGGLFATLMILLVIPFQTRAAEFTGSAAVPLASAAQAGFQETIVFSGLTNPTVLHFSPDGRIFIAEKSGLIKVFDNLTDPSPTIFADLRTNVHNFWDRGLLGLTLHPNFPTMPYVYVLYTYDGVIGGTAPRWGTAGATSDSCPTPPGATSDGCVVSGRLSRLQASGNVMTGSELVLIHDWCQQYPSHSGGALVFGTDGALYASAGEGASFTFTDYGQEGSPPNPCGDPPVPVGGSQTVPSTQGGALRSQDLRTSGDPVTLGGTIIRIDPNTGAAMPNNPLISNSNPNARRIIAYGLRNPLRFVLRPGASDLWIGDVGWRTWEELNRIGNPTDAIVENFGWPCYEGAGKQSIFDGLNVTLCENLYAQSGAVTPPYFRYQHDTLITPGETCAPGSSSISGLAFSRASGGPYPASYNGALFLADYSRNCIWVMRPGTNGLPNPATITPFVTAAAGPVDLKLGLDGNLYYVDFNGGTVRRIRYTGTTSTLPSPWLNQDVGGVAVGGKAGYANGTFTVQGSGADIGGTSDEFHYVLQPLSGNGVITARVNSLTNTHPSAKAGVMIRETLNANAKHVMTVITPGQGASLQRRTAIGGSTASTTLASITVPDWLRLKRSGTTFTAWRSYNGTSWTQIGSATVSLSTNVYVGLAVTSHNDGVVTTAKFDKVRITKSLPPTPTISLPASSLTWKVGDTINFSGSATDAEDGPLSAAALTWSIIMRHCPSTCHTHTIQTFTGVSSGSFSAPDHEYPSSLEIKLTARDSSGTESVKSLIVNPKTVNLTFTSIPSGLRLGLNDTTFITPVTKTVIVNSQNSINALTPQTLNGTTYVFSSWSDGRAASHNIIAPASATTYTATFSR